MNVPGTNHYRDAGESDWDDQDLLTVDEARHRLQEEVELAAERLERAKSAGSASPAELTALQDRLDALTAAQRRSQRRSPLIGEAGD